jgi:hypothetical protein
VKKTVLLYGLLGGVLIALLKLVEYRYLVLEHSLEIYGGIVALVFAVVGIWLTRLGLDVSFQFIDTGKPDLTAFTFGASLLDIP